MVKTFIVVEASTNHHGNMSDIKSITYKVKQCGRDALKFQTYATEMRVVNNPRSEVFRDHSNDILTTSLEILFDATTIEKHLILDLNNGVLCMKSAERSCASFRRIS